MSTSPPALPRNFDHWLGPWRVGLMCWIAGDVFDDDNLMVERDVWMREYQEQSHCDTPGCCEMKSFILGPKVSGIRVVRTVEPLHQLPGEPTLDLTEGRLLPDLPQPGEPTMNLLWPERRGLLDGLAHLFRNRKAPTKRPRARGRCRTATDV